MSSRDGFSRADVDTGFYSDPKVVALHRRLRDHAQTACATTLYLAVMCASWKADERLSLAEAAPAWWLDDPDEFLADLQAVGLLDDEGRVTEKAFAAWTARARAAIQKATNAADARWEKERQEKAKQSPSIAQAKPEQSKGIAQPAGQPPGLAAGAAAGTDEPTDRRSPDGGSNGSNGAMHEPTVVSEVDVLALRDEEDRREAEELRMRGNR